MPARISAVDLAGEWAEVGAAVEAAVVRVLRSGAYVLGPETEAFEGELAKTVGARFALGVGSGTEALVLALRALGVGTGDEVVTSPFTYFATVEAIRMADARPVFVDVEPGGFNLDPAGLEAALSPRTRAVLPVHLFGRCADMERIRAVADARGVPVVEDAAQAVGARRGGRGAGAWGAAGCFSFYPTKNLAAAGDGGAVTTDDPELADRIRLLRSHGSRVRDVHRVVGTTSRLDSLQAAVLRAKLPHLESWTRARAGLARGYAERLAGAPGVRLPEAGPDEAPVWHQYAIRVEGVERRAAVCCALDDANVEWRHFYPRPAYVQEALGDLRLPEGTCPEAERACREVVCLPIHPRLHADELDRVADAVTRGARAV
jgi:dTDP-4-amino-4,6-dideoxygalactose transaminase